MKTAQWKNRLIGENTKEVILINISEHDNTIDKAFEVNRSLIDERINIHVSYPYMISDIVEV